MQARRLKICFVLLCLRKIFFRQSSDGIRAAFPLSGGTAGAGNRFAGADGLGGSSGLGTPSDGHLDLAAIPDGLLGAGNNYESGHHLVGTRGDLFDPCLDVVLGDLRFLDDSSGCCG